MKRENYRSGRSAVWAAAFAGTLFGAVIFAGNPLSALGAEVSPVTVYDEETLAKFSDDTLEYWEIPGLIEQYNTDFKNQLEQFYNNPGGATGLTRDRLLSLAKELRAEAEDLEHEAEDLKDEIAKPLYEEYQNNIRALKRYAKELEDAAEGKTAAGRSAIRGLRITREKQTRSAGEKMRTYQKLAAQAEIAKKQLEAAEVSFQSAERQKELGLFSEEDVLSAREALTAAQAEALAADAAAESGKQDLLTMLGWNYGGDPAIAAIPEPDLNWLSSRDLAADTAKAMENNHTLYDTRLADSASLGGADKKARTIKDQETAVTQNMEQLYKDAEQKKAAYEAALTDFAAAEGNKAAADRKFFLGLLSRQQYLAEEAAYLTARASKDAAGLDLTASMENYEWAVKGHLEIGGGQG